MPGAPDPIVPPGRLAYGIQLPVQSQSTLYADPWEADAGPTELAAVARAADESGFLYVAVCDHTVIPARLAPAMGLTWYDTVATLGWLAALTTRVRLLSHIYVAGLRHPLRAAKEFATLDRLSGGRVIIGVGAGHVPEEFEALGGDFAARGALLDEAIAGIAAGLAEEYPTLEGPRWPATGLGIGPRPVQRPRPPIWVGGSSRPALRRAAALGDGWLPQTVRRRDLQAQIAELRQLRAARGGPDLELGALVPSLYVGAASWELPAGARSGSGEELAEWLRELGGLGVAHVQIRFANRSAGELCDQLRAFGAEVGPLLTR